MYIFNPNRHAPILFLFGLAGLICLPYCAYKKHSFSEFSSPDGRTCVAMAGYLFSKDQFKGQCEKITAAVLDFQRKNTDSIILTFSDAATKITIPFDNISEATLKAELEKFNRHEAFYIIEDRRNWGTALYLIPLMLCFAIVTEFALQNRTKSVDA